MNASGKGNTLEYIASQLPHIPIPPFERVSRESWFASIRARRIARRIGYPLIIRSDGPEGRLGASFAGLFHSEVVRTPEEIEIAFEKVRNHFDYETVEKYCRDRSLQMPLGSIDAIIQKYSDSLIRASITRHPHQENEFYLDLEWNLQSVRPFRAGFVLDGQDFRKEVQAYMRTKGRQPASLQKFDINDLSAQVDVALHHFQEIESLPEFERNVAHQMESGLMPYSVYQWRPFRKKEHADFRIDDVSFDGPYDETHVVFGVTPKRGIELVHFPVDGPRGFVKLQHSGFSNKEDVILEKQLAIARLYESLQGKTPIHTIAVSSHEIGYYATEFDYMSLFLPRLLIFNGPDNYGWQVHSTFRLLERATLVALADNAPYLSIKGNRMHYWSDGIKGRIQFLS